jgi:hypothetical protein
MSYLNSNEVERYIASYRESDAFVRHCIEAISIIDVSLDLMLLVIDEYGPGVLADAAAAPEWMVGRPWLTDTGTGRHTFTLKEDGQ